MRLTIVFKSPQIGYNLLLTNSIRLPPAPQTQKTVNQCIYSFFLFSMSFLQYSNYQNRNPKSHFILPSKSSLSASGSSGNFTGRLSRVER